MANTTMEEIMNAREDLPEFLNQKGLIGTGVEVGVLRADFSFHILSKWRGEKLYLVDGWRHIPGLEDVNNPDHNGHLDSMAKAMMKIYTFGERATMIRELSVPASKLFQDCSLDFVYIDAGHDYKSVSADLEAWFPKVKRGGLIMGDDYAEGYWEGPEKKKFTKFEVIKAVDDFFGEGRVSLTPAKQNEYYKPNWWTIK